MQGYYVSRKYATNPKGVILHGKDGVLPPFPKMILGNGTVVLSHSSMIATISNLAVMPI
jgi:hypothetical protein